ncbi:MAG: hypothetical protein KAQ63_03370, partial [Candidatus Moranbacteria bacterium]|nr:hypothetical protein [Candidatus Moranbacteria bacterium]
SGNVGVGTTSFGTDAGSVLAIASSTAPTTSITDGIQLYAVDAAGSHELIVRDEAGNATTLSPHNFSLMPEEEEVREALAWSYYSERDKTAINVDMTKAMRLIEQLSGKKLVYKVDLETGEELEEEIAFTENINLLLNIDEQGETIASLREDFESLLSRYNIEKDGTQLRLAEIETVIDGLNTFDSLAVNQLSSHEERITALETAIGLGAMISGGEFEIDIIAGDVKFAGVVTAEKLETEVIVAGEYTIVNNEVAENEKNTGSATIYGGQSEVFIENLKVKSDSKIIVTPIGNSPVNWIISEKKEGEGFRIKLMEVAEFDVTFDYWIVQTEG